MTSKCNWNDVIINIDNLIFYIIKKIISNIKIIKKNKIQKIKKEMEKEIKIV